MFNRYVWSLYRQSPRGNRAICQAFPRFAHIACNTGDANWRDQLDTDIPFIDISSDATEDGQPPAGSIRLRQLLAAWFDEHNDLSEGFRSLLEGDGLCYEWPSEDEQNRIFFASFGGEEFALDIATHIGCVTTVMHRMQPEAFAPYFFQGRFKLLSDICKRFQIALPGIPGKLQKRERSLFYLEVNNSLQEFRQRQDLTPAELNAFLYDFAPACLADDVDCELPAPQRAWFLMAGIGTEADFVLLDTATQTSEFLWRGHRDAQRGDIAILWCASPRAYLHSIWRIVEDGYDDPFAHWYSLVRVGTPQTVPHLKIKDLKANPVLAASPLVRAHFQGCAGKYFRPDDYLALLDECARRGADIGKLPKVSLTPVPFTTNGSDISNERAVEVNLIEPLLDQLGFQMLRDWRRQVVVRMGRGDKVYPDYVLGLIDTPDHECAQIIIESKYRIATRKELLDAFRQGRSYALRLQAKRLVLAALEGIWLLHGEQGFSLENARQWTWDQLADAGVRQEVRKLLGYQRS